MRAKFAPLPVHEECVHPARSSFRLDYRSVAQRIGPASVWLFLGLFAGDAVAGGLRLRLEAPGCRVLVRGADHAWTGWRDRGLLHSDEIRELINPSQELGGRVARVHRSSATLTLAAGTHLRVAGNTLQLLEGSVRALGEWNGVTLHCGRLRLRLLDGDVLVSSRQGLTRIAVLSGSAALAERRLVAGMAWRSCVGPELGCAMPWPRAPWLPHWSEWDQVPSSRADWDAAQLSRTASDSQAPLGRRMAALALLGNLGEQVEIRGLRREGWRGALEWQRLRLAGADASSPGELDRWLTDSATSAALVHALPATWGQPAPPRATFGGSRWTVPRIPAALRAARVAEVCSADLRQHGAALPPQSAHAGPALASVVSAARQELGIVRAPAAKHPFAHALCPRAPAWDAPPDFSPIIFPRPSDTPAGWAAIQNFDLAEAQRIARDLRRLEARHDAWDRRVADWIRSAEDSALAGAGGYPILFGHRALDALAERSFAAPEGDPVALAVLGEILGAAPRAVAADLETRWLALRPTFIPAAGGLGLP